MSRRLSMTAGAVLTISCLVSEGAARPMAMDLDKPSIAIPSEGGKLDIVVERMQRVLAAHAKEFTGGTALNALSTLHFKGGTKTVNTLLDELSKVDGVTLNVRLSKAAGVTRMIVGERGSCSCSVQHNAWAK
jgi:hypothetical protein